jgi:CDP-6-deoxy-D-xylo-4-hexulose-3-dehydrase
MKIDLVEDTIDNNDIDKLIEWLSTYPRLTKGPKTIEFEKKWSEWLGVKYSVFVNSGSSANLLMFYALITLNMMKNKKVCVPSLCWATDLAPVLQFNLEPILIDCNLENLSVEYVGLILRKEDRSTNKAIKKKASSHFCKFFATYRNFKANNTS